MSSIQMARQRLNEAMVEETLARVARLVMALLAPSLHHPVAPQSLSLIETAKKLLPRLCQQTWTTRRLFRFLIKQNLATRNGLPAHTCQRHLFFDGHVPVPVLGLFLNHRSLNVRCLAPVSRSQLQSQKLKPQQKSRQCQRPGL